MDKKNIVEKYKEISPFVNAKESIEQAEAWIEAAKEAYKLHTEKEWDHSRHSTHWRANWLRERGVNQFGREWSPFRDGRPNNMSWFKWMWRYKNFELIMIVFWILLFILALSYFS